MEKRITDISGYSKFNLVQKSDSGCADSGNPSLFFLPVILFLHVMQVHSWAVSGVLLSFAWEEAEPSHPQHCPLHEHILGADQAEQDGFP